MEFFNKYRPPLSLEEKNELRRLSSLDLQKFNESDVREEFIVPLLRLLGYRKELDYSVSREEIYKLNPLFIYVGRDQIKLDYITSVRKQYFWIIEAKSANSTDGTPVEILSKEILQAYFYALHPEVDSPYFVVCNGWYTNLYIRDEIGQDLKPILSIPFKELENRFFEIDQKIGTTQILPFIKNALVKKIEKVLSAEVYLERLDEFKFVVDHKINQIRPIVLENFRNNARVQEAKAKKDCLDALENAKPDDFAFTIFMGTSAPIAINPAIEIIISRLKTNLIHSNQYMLFHKLLLVEPRPVTVDFYHNVLRLLLRMNDAGIESLPHYQNTNVLQLTLQWVELCLFHFTQRKELRFLWLLDGFICRLNKRLILLNIKLRDVIRQATNSEIAILNEEAIAYHGPSPASKYLQLIEDTSMRIQGDFLSRNYNYNKRQLNEVIALQELNEISVYCQEVENKTDMEYNKLKSELGDKWGELLFIDNTNNPFDRLASGVCNLLLESKAILPHLPDIVKRRIKFIAGLGIANYANELCAELGQKPFVPKNFDLKEYYAPEVNVLEQISPD